MPIDPDVTVGTVARQTGVLTSAETLAIVLSALIINTALVDALGRQSLSNRTQPPSWNRGSSPHLKMPGFYGWTTKALRSG